VLVLKTAGLVYLANPKTATQAVRSMLAPHALTSWSGREGRHMNAHSFHLRWKTRVERELGRTVETVAVMREPRAQMESWFRYRQRSRRIGHRHSTHGMGFAEFVAARLAPEPPPFAQIGRQDRFLGFLRGGPPVTHVFDYARLDLLVGFLSDRLGAPLLLPERNVSPLSDVDLRLPPHLEQRYRSAHAAEFDLYARVAAEGVLVTPG
jgi:hypothetical protein